MGSIITYIEAQGMGLPVADIAEWTAMNRALTELMQAYGESVVPGQCAVSTLKPMTGHMHSASSLAAMMKIIKSFQSHKIYKVLGYDQPNPYCDMQDAPCRIVKENEAWESFSYQRLAALHAYGAGGNNAHVLLEEAPRENNSIKQSCLPEKMKPVRCWFDETVPKTATSVSSHDDNKKISRQAWSEQIVRQTLASWLNQPEKRNDLRAVASACRDG